MRDTSDLRAWYREDIARMLTSINAASLATHDDTSEYRRGFVAALACVALATGVDLDVIIGAMQRNGEHG